jgi:hypothetical protein
MGVGGSSSGVDMEVPGVFLVAKLGTGYGFEVIQYDAPLQL